MDDHKLNTIRRHLCGEFTREDWNPLWHTAPQTARASIEKKGLLAGRGGGHGLTSAPGVPYPRAVYLTSHPGHIGMLDHTPFENEAFDTDIWQIDTAGLDLEVDWPAIYEHGASFEEGGGFWFKSDAFHELMKMGDEFHPHTIGDPLPWMALTGTCCVHGDITPERMERIKISDWTARYGREANASL